jgi:hypothetical protein
MSWWRFSTFRANVDHETRRRADESQADAEKILTDPDVRPL